MSLSSSASCRLHSIRLLATHTRPRMTHTHIVAKNARVSTTVSTNTVADNVCVSRVTLECVTSWDESCCSRTSHVMRGNESCCTPQRTSTCTHEYVHVRARTRIYFAIFLEQTRKTNTASGNVCDSCYACMCVCESFIAYMCHILGRVTAYAQMSHIPHGNESCRTLQKTITDIYIVMSHTMHMNVYMCIFVSSYVCIHIYLYLYLYICIYVYIYEYIYAGWLLSGHAGVRDCGGPTARRGSAFHSDGRAPAIAQTGRPCDTAGKVDVYT